jgi:hypothetical protein
MVIADCFPFLKYYTGNVLNRQMSDKLRKEYNTMAKSRLVKANQKIEKAVVGGYKKIEKTVVGGYQKIEDKFVDQYLTKDGETVKEAKARILKEQKARS